MEWTLAQFVAESNSIEGITRSPTGEEIEAHERFLALTYLPVIANLREFVSTVQPEAVLRNQPGLDVRVGGYIPPRGGQEVEYALRVLLSQKTPRNAFQTHIAYELLHPFTDGNGRSGRVLWLWMMGGHALLGFLHQFYYQTLAATELTHD